MDSSLSAKDSDYPPQRLSALYQYHNAPEVAPAHGLEYDDTLYSHAFSDKFSVIKELPFRSHNYSGRHASDDDNDTGPPRIIFGMKVRTFLFVAAIMSLIVIGAAVGGAVGGRQIHSSAAISSAMPGDSSTTKTLTVPTSTPPLQTTTTPTFEPPSPTYTPLSSCPQANNTLYTSPFLLPPLLSTPQTFTLYCNLIPSQHFTRLLEAYVYTFTDCVDLCASYNFFSSSGGSGSGSDCEAVFYSPAGSSRPSNCWMGTVGGALIGGQLQVAEGIGVGILMSGV